MPRNHSTPNEQLLEVGPPLPVALAELAVSVIPTQVGGEYDAPRPLDENREEALHQLGDKVLSYIMDGNVITVTRDHLLHTAENFGGALTRQEVGFLLSHTVIDERLETTDCQGDLFAPKPGRQRKPLDVAPPKKMFKDLRGKYRNLF